MTTCPQYPIYIPSKSRADNAKTPYELDRLNVPYRIIVEEQQYDAYRENFPKEKLLVLDKTFQDEYETLDDIGYGKSKGPGAARNFAWHHSIQEGHKWHWVMDDNIRIFARLHKNKKLRVGDGTMFHAMEDFCSRYTNIGMAGPHYWMFAPSRTARKPFIVGTRVYSSNPKRSTYEMERQIQRGHNTQPRHAQKRLGNNTVLCFLTRQTHDPTNERRKHRSLLRRRRNIPQIKNASRRTPRRIQNGSPLRQNPPPR